VSRPIQIACAWCGILFVFVLFGGIIAAGWIPPIQPSHSADQVARYYQEHANGIRTMAVMVMFGAGLTIPFAALMATHVRRMEGSSFAPLFAVNLIGGAAGACAIFMPAMLLGAAAYRPDRSPEITQALNDLAWVPFIMNGPPAIAQAVSFGLAVLGDRSERPAFPRWLGFYNFWVAFCFLPACILVYFKHGPFAWNGLLSFWLAATVFGTYFIIMGVMFIRAATVVQGDARDVPAAELVAA
jgi:hypothetical protein